MKALVVTSDSFDTDAVMERCRAKDMDAAAVKDANQALDMCRDSAPDLVIVEERLDSMDAKKFLSELLKISWATSAILVSDKDEETIHEEYEGLGILGHFSGPGDSVRLEELLDRSISIR